MNIKYNFIFLNLFLIILQYNLAAQSPVFEHTISKDAKYLDADELTPFYEGYAVLRKGNAEMMIDKNGNKIFPYLKYTFPNMEDNHGNWMGNKYKKKHIGFHEGRCFVRNQNENKIFLIDQNDMELIPMVENSRPEILDNGYIQYVNYPQRIYYDINNNEKHVPQSSYKQVKPLPKTIEKYDISVADLENNLLWIHKYISSKEIFGLATFDGNILIDPIFYEKQDFSEGLACVAKLNEFGELKWGYIDLKGETIIDFKFTKKPSSFHNGLAVVIPSVYSGYQYSYIDKLGIEKLKIINSNNREVHEGNYGQNLYSELFNDGKMVNRFDNIIDHELKLYNTSGISLDLYLIAKNAINKIGLKDIVETRFKNYPFYNDGVLYYYRNNSDSYLKGNLGMIILDKNKFIPPFFTHLDSYDKVSGLTLAHTYIKGKEVKGYINEQAEFVFILKEKSKW